MGIITMTRFHLYCGYDSVSAVFVFAHIISFIREIGFALIILYLYIYRLKEMNINAKNIKYDGHYTAKKIKKMEKEKKKKNEGNKKTKSEEKKEGKTDGTNGDKQNKKEKGKKKNKSTNTTKDEA